MLTVSAGGGEILRQAFSCCPSVAGVDEVNLYHDFASGLRDDRPALDSCLRFLRKGDVLVVWKLDRLGRNLAHLIRSQTNVLGHEDAGGFPASACMPLRPAQSSPRPARPGCTRRTRAHESWPLLDTRAPPFRKKTVTSKCSCRFLLVVLQMPSCRFSQDSCELIRTRPARHR